jgi:hypothetical protein
MNVAIDGWVSELVNSIPNISDLSYLELGLGAGRNFNSIRSIDKLSVDINPHLYLQTSIKEDLLFTGTTDEFFAQNKRRFDVIFIDADHRVEAVVKDFNNAIKVANKYVFLHDLYPPNEQFTQPCWSGDGYKMLYKIVKDNLFPIYVLDTDYGLSVVKVSEATSINNVEDISYNEFCQLPIHRYSVDQFKEVLCQQDL